MHIAHVRVQDMHTMHGIHDCHLAHIQIYLFILLGFLVTSPVRPTDRPTEPDSESVRPKSEIRNPSEIPKSEIPICSKSHLVVIFIFCFTWIISSILPIPHDFHTVAENLHDIGLPVVTPFLYIYTLVLFPLFESVAVCVYCGCGCLGHCLCIAPPSVRFFLSPRPPRSRLIQHART